MLQYLLIQSEKCFNAGAQDAVSLHEGRIDFSVRARGMRRVFHAPMGAQHGAKVDRASLSRRTGTNGDDYIGRGGKIFPRLAEIAFGGYPFARQ